MVTQASSNTGVACEAELRARILTRSEGDVLKVNGRRCTFCRQDQQRPLGSRMAEAAYCRICVLTLWQGSRATPEQRNGRQMLRGRGRELPKSQSTVHPCYCRQGVEADGPKSEPRGCAPLTKFTQVERSKLGCRTVDTAQTDQTHPCRVPSVRIVRVIGRKNSHDTLRLREVFPHRRDSVVLRSGS